MHSMWRHFILLVGVVCSLTTNAYCGEVPLIDLAKHAQYRDVKISPDGDYLAATAQIKDKAALALIRLSDLKGNNVGGDYDSEIADFDWVGPHQVMYSLGEFSGYHE